MKRSTRNQAEGRARELKGAIKEKTGKATNNRDLQGKGMMEKTGGKVQKKAGDFEKDLEEDEEQ
jgi:uncharacterized protein YjbJ (UPF0337 family)